MVKKGAKNETGRMVIAIAIINIAMICCVGCSNSPNLSTPESAIESTLAAIESRDYSRFLACIASNNTLPEKDFEDVREVYQKHFSRLRGKVKDDMEEQRSVDWWCDKIYWSKRGRVAVQVKREGEDWKVVSFMFNREYYGSPFSR